MSEENLESALQCAISVKYKQKLKDSAWRKNEKCPISNFYTDYMLKWKIRIY